MLRTTPWTRYCMYRGIVFPVLLAAISLPSSGVARAATWPDPGGVLPSPELAVPSESLAPQREPRRASGPRAWDAQDRSVWRTLVLIYRNMDVTSGTSHWSTTMSDAQVAILQRATASYLSIASEWSAGLGRLSCDVRVISRPIGTLSPVFDGYYWVTPDDVAAELEPALTEKVFDSVIVLWDGGPVPTNYWGLAYVGPIYWHGHPFTWSTVLKGQDSWWGNSAPGEVILHEWLHGVEGHYRNSGYLVPDLHGAETHGYSEESGGGWRTWLTDYMQGHVLENGDTIGVSPGVWASGPVNNPVRPYPCQLLSPGSETGQAISPTLRWAPVPAASFRIHLTNLADGSPAYESVTTSNSAVPAQSSLHRNVRYLWQVTSLDNGAESGVPEGRAFLYTGSEAPNVMIDAVRALQASAGVFAPGPTDMGRLNVRTDAESGGRVDIRDASVIIRRAMGLDP